ncbi:hypothetical protein Tdes44962_MAKER07135 [Teratosphaeria destructans]|uniref:Uncharacterized protein n=1 Tax=Teratosphaeria destructans TaxID=418781 RepID=A0A9W7SZM2_9PEZI|nr:hypothetical protein Tdes44962_MAKER07135 [Teratosphaeria destructans]
MNEQLKKGAQKLNDDCEEFWQQHATDHAELARLNALLRGDQCQATPHDMPNCPFRQAAQFLKQ